MDVIAGVATTQNLLRAIPTVSPPRSCPPLGGWRTSCCLVASRMVTTPSRRERSACGWRGITWGHHGRCCLEWFVRGIKHCLTSFSAAARISGKFKGSTDNSRGHPLTEDVNITFTNLARDASTATVRLEACAASRDHPSGVFRRR